MSFAKRFCRDPNTMERKLSTKKHIFESIFFSDGQLYNDNTFGIRFNKPIRFIFKDNSTFPNPSLLVVEYSFSALFEREVEPSYEESDPICWQMVNFRIGLIKRSIKIESTFTPSNPEVDDATFRSNLISFFRIKSTFHLMLMLDQLRISNGSTIQQTRNIQIHKSSKLRTTTTQPGSKG